MAITTEFVVSRAATVDTLGEAPSHERIYKIQGTQDHDEALTELIAAAPSSVTISGYVLGKVEFEVQEADYNLFSGSARYSKFTKNQAGEHTYNFDITTESQHITNSWRTVARYGSAPDLNGMIGWDGENVGGTDILAATYGFSEQHTITDASMTAAYKAAIYRCAGKVNNAPFKGFASGEVLFLGASGTVRTNDSLLWDVNFRFIASETLTNLSVGGISGITKRGWDHLWILYADAVGTDGLYKVPRGVYVEEVYRFANFATLGIGT